MTFAGRFPMQSMVSSRVRNSLTGRAVFLASRTAIGEYLPVASLLPNPPPT
jgi:hypothetical protein